MVDTDFKLHRHIKSLDIRRQRKKYFKIILGTLLCLCEPNTSEKKLRE